jgi:hypothetical protein
MHRLSRLWDLVHKESKRSAFPALIFGDALTRVSPVIGWRNLACGEPDGKNVSRRAKTWAARTQLRALPVDSTHECLTDVHNNRGS